MRRFLLRHVTSARDLPPPQAQQERLGQHLRGGGVLPQVPVRDQPVRQAAGQAEAEASRYQQYAVSELFGQGADEAGSNSQCDDKQQ